MARYLFEHLEEILQAARTATHLALFPDYDGTLTPIAPTYQEVVNPYRDRLRITEGKDAFAALPDGVTVRLGLIPEEPTRARYYVRSTEEVRAFLQHLQAMRAVS